MSPLTEMHVFSSNPSRTQARQRHAGAGPQRRLPVLAVALAALWLAGCTVGPDYVAPTPTTPETYHDLARTTGNVNDSSPVASEPDPAWWRNFNDPLLDTLVERAIAGNLSLQQAVLRIAESREQVTQSGAAGLPTVSAGARATRQQLGLQGILDSQHIGERAEALSPEANGVLGQLTQPVNLYQVNFDASWELDLFGKVRRSVEAAQAAQQQSIEDRNDGLVSLEAEVARAYLQLRGAQAIAQLLATQIRLSEDTVALTRNRQQNGLAPQSDVENASAQLAGLRAQLPSYEAQTRQAMNGLAVLLGQAPGTLDAELALPAGQVVLPAVPPAVPVGIPAALARRRPDIRRAEATLHQATASIGVSIAQLFPSLSLTGQFGMRNSQASYLTRWASHFYSFGPSVSLPIFQGGRLVSNVRLSRAQQAEAVLGYRQAVLDALREVENGLVAYRTDQDRVRALDASLAAQQNNFDLASESYRKGLVSFINVIDAQRQLTDTQQQVANARVQLSTDLVSLYKALGGGWQPYQDVTLPQYKVFGPAGQVTPQ
ncbi:efflux transporter outer membrane subunit [Chitinasiproducens palmae]|uniref:Efflux transporter, outer membrane factor (OMF) lipoprotein, NodT family n=1 Tax=Chitinasiproducens palmae TaxID=1770053 RepID=A0A1H2PRT9_9BURK|nr:efflux transporter outer membrane subunit [Chitinasiproducens palmae]SDV49643.1 efflux transporter, outer membrane factor (OMF) lipoprotein, NodT family [Chitinasiproducens palmae]